LFLAIGWAGGQSASPCAVEQGPFKGPPGPGPDPADHGGPSRAQATGSVPASSRLATLTPCQEHHGQPVNGPRALSPRRQVHKQGSRQNHNVAPFPGAGSQKGRWTWSGTTAPVAFRQVILQPPKQGRPTTPNDHAHRRVPVPAKRGVVVGPRAPRVASAVPLRPSSRPAQFVGPKRAGPWGPMLGRERSNPAGRARRMSSRSAQPDRGATPRPSASHHPATSTARALRPRVAALTPGPAFLPAVGVSTVAGASGDASLVTATSPEACSIQQGSTNCADRLEAKQVGLQNRRAVQQPNVQTVLRAASLSGVPLPMFRPVTRPTCLGQGHQVFPASATQSNHDP